MVAILESRSKNVPDLTCIRDVLLLRDKVGGWGRGVELTPYVPFMRAGRVFSLSPLLFV